MWRSPILLQRGLHSPCLHEVSEFDFTCDILAANVRTGCAPAAAICGGSSMAARQGCLRQAFAQVTRLATSIGEALVHWLQSSSTGAIRLATSAGEALVHWLKEISIDDVIVVAEMQVENFGTEQVPIHLPKITTDLVVFDYIGQF